MAWAVTLVVVGRLKCTGGALSVTPLDWATPWIYCAMRFPSVSTKKLPLVNPSTAPCSSHSLEI